ncbi:hypothetical protein GOBAR_DD36906 [Gossypium barbadense]|nr:hypothetical protein GOBAR_DD36906 [Gossypium barbadense]
MTTPLPISFFPILLLIPAVCFTICHANSNLLCIQSEREALLKFKHHLIDPSNRLSSWVEGGDCCEWTGVVCHNSTGHVNKLHLAAPLSEPDGFATNAEMEAYYNSRLGGKINPSLLELKHLSSLDLSYNDFNSIHIPKFFGLLESLTYLNLSGALFQGAIPHKLGNLSKLQYLDLRGNDLEPKSLQWVSGLSSLQYLDLSYANLSKAKDWIQSLNRLQFLSLGNNQLQGTISSAIGNLSSVTQLDLSVNQLNDQIPLSIGELSSLKLFDVSKNQLNGQIPLSIGQLTSLEKFDVSENQLNGQIPLSIGELSSLKLFDVSKNQLNGQIPWSIGQLSSLKLFDVSENQLNGTFPLSLGRLESLETLDCGYNLLEGVVSETHFSNLTRLTTLAASHNRLRFEPNSSWIPPFQCERIELGNWHLGPKFPQWLKFQKKLSYLDISCAGISDVMPTWFLNLPTQFKHLNLSSNQLRGEISYLNVRNIVDLSSNRFIGPLPRVFPTLPFLILSNNSFSGSLFELLCNSSSEKGMEVLYIDKNLISGDIPDCWNHWQRLILLNLGSNNLTGKIPPSLWHLNLKMLNLRNNTMFGELPSTLQNSPNLIMFDLSENHFSGSVPAWIGREDEYGSTLGLVTSMDLSANSLTGEIPKEIGSLVGLLSLNFSGNLLTGNIPDSIGNMELMESLDLSMNRLNGEIPPSFSNLNFLNHFNVSYNNLTGQIPTSTQLQSFENLSYVGNHLCGPPLTKNCTSKGIPIDVANNGSSREGSKVNWLYVSIVLGFVMGFWGVVAPLFFIRSWRHAYYRKLDHVGRKLYVSWATMGM